MYDILFNIALPTTAALAATVCIIHDIRKNNTKKVIPAVTMPKATITLPLYSDTLVDYIPNTSTPYTGTINPITSSCDECYWPDVHYVHPGHGTSLCEECLAKLRNAKSPEAIGYLPVHTYTFYFGHPGYKGHRCTCGCVQVDDNKCILCGATLTPAPAQEKSTLLAYTPKQQDETITEAIFGTQVRKKPGTKAKARKAKAEENTWQDRARQPRRKGHKDAFKHYTFCRRGTYAPEVEVDETHALIQPKYTWDDLHLEVNLQADNRELAAYWYVFPLPGENGTSTFRESWTL